MDNLFFDALCKPCTDDGCLVGAEDWGKCPINCLCHDAELKQGVFA